MTNVGYWRLENEPWFKIELIPKELLNREGSTSDLFLKREELEDENRVRNDTNVTGNKIVPLLDE